jgi:diketogulonate reductase-like aldo/keto reductase
MYGYGEAEGCLGEFLEQHRDATVTTKYGIAPAKRGGLLRAARRVAGPLVQRVPALKKRLQRAAGAVAPSAKSRFSPEEARASLENSLRELRIGFIDVLLLHEAEAADLGDDNLLRFLEDAVAQGKIGSFGAGSDSAKLGALLRERPSYCRVLQHDWSVLHPAETSSDAFHIHHSALTGNLTSLDDRLKRDSGLCRRWSEETGVDLSRRERLAALMLKASLVLHRESIVLVSSKNTSHIGDNIHIEEDEKLAGPARRLYELVQREGVASAADLLPEESR